MDFRTDHGWARAGQPPSVKMGYPETSRLLLPREQAGLPWLLEGREDTDPSCPGAKVFALGSFSVRHQVPVPLSPEVGPVSSTASSMTRKTGWCLLFPLLETSGCVPVPWGGETSLTVPNAYQTAHSPFAYVCFYKIRMKNPLGFNTFDQDTLLGNSRTHCGFFPVGPHVDGARQLLRMHVVAPMTRLFLAGRPCLWPLTPCAFKCPPSALCSLEQTSPGVGFWFSDRIIEPTQAFPRASVFP
ncbi:hypothetical protein H1C71_005306 [Ictidomys tridecemlineatus]|nr:hypothetical protein H1C71_005306 [Ictidomys tridecemlineatus]